MIKSLPPHEDVELQLVFGDNGKVTLVGVVTTGKYTGTEIILLNDVKLDMERTDD